MGILVKGIYVAGRSVFYTLTLLTSITYIFALIFRQLTKGDAIGERYFRDVPSAMATLLLKGIIPDMEQLIDSLGDASYFFGVFGLLFVLLASLIVMNMLVGILVQVVSVVQAVEKEEMDVNFVKQQLQNMFENGGLDTDGDMKISRGEFSRLLSNPEAAKAIEDVGVDPVALVDYIDYIFEGCNDEDGGVSFANLVEVIFEFRGSHTSTVKDIVDMRKFVLRELKELAYKMESLELRVDRYSLAASRPASGVVTAQGSSEPKAQDLRESAQTRATSIATLPAEDSCPF